MHYEIYAAYIYLIMHHPSAGPDPMHYEIIYCIEFEPVQQIIGNLGPKSAAVPYYFDPLGCISIRPWYAFLIPFDGPVKFSLQLLGPRDSADFIHRWQ